MPAAFSFLLVPAQAYVGQFLETFKDYPQRQKAASFNLTEVLEKLKKAVDQSSAGAAGSITGSGNKLRGPMHDGRAAIVGRERDL